MIGDGSESSSDGEGSKTPGMESGAFKARKSNTDSNVNTGSVSSTASSKQSTTDTEIKYVEEGIDYDKTPKPLAYL